MNAQLAFDAILYTLAIYGACRIVIDAVDAVWPVR